jgi:hypothetical protein
MQEKIKRSLLSHRFAQGLTRLVAVLVILLLSIFFFFFAQTLGFQQRDMSLATSSFVTPEKVCYFRTSFLALVALQSKGFLHSLSSSRPPALSLSAQPHPHSPPPSPHTLSPWHTPFLKPQHLLLHSPKQQQQQQQPSS